MSPYSVSIDLARRMVLITMTGLLDAETARRSIIDIDAAVAEVNRRAGPHVTLVDITGFQVQMQSVTDISKHYFATFTNKPLRLAIVTGVSDLVKMQTKRILGNEPVAFFKDIDEAKTWLAQAFDRRAA